MVNNFVTWHRVTDLPHTDPVVIPDDPIIEQETPPTTIEASVNGVNKIEENILESKVNIKEENELEKTYQPVEILEDVMAENEFTPKPEPVIKKPTPPEAVKPKKNSTTIKKAPNTETTPQQVHAVQENDVEKKNHNNNDDVSDVNFLNSIADEYTEEEYNEYPNNNNIDEGNDFFQQSPLSMEKIVLQHNHQPYSYVPDDCPVCSYTKQKYEEKLYSQEEDYYKDFHRPQPQYDPKPVKNNEPSRDISHIYADFEWENYLPKSTFQKTATLGSEHEDLSHVEIRIKGRAKRGWRSKVLVPLPKNRREKNYDKLIANISMVPATSKIIGVMSFKGGVGTTTVTAGLGSTICKYSIYKPTVIGVDAVPLGSLGARISNSLSFDVKEFLTMMIEDRPQVLGNMTMQRFLRGNDWGFNIIPSSHTPDEWHLSGAQWMLLANSLRTVYNYIIVDLAPHNNSLEAVAPIMGCLDGLVIVTSARQDSLDRAKHVRDWLGVIDGLENPFAFNDQDRFIDTSRLQSSVTLAVVTHPFVNRLEKVNAAVDSARQYVHDTDAIEIPYDLSLDTGGLIVMDKLSKRVRMQFLKLGASVLSKLPNF